jgi:FAD/FMN-containing dehydrogenase
VNRREFLQRSGLAVAALAIPGCATVVKQMTPRPSPTPSPTPLGPPTAADWASLASQLSGSVVLPSGTSYATDAHLFNPRFDSILPAGIVYCASVSDVQRTLAFAQVHAIPITPRSGGHSYAGYSTTTGVVCDVTRMAGVTLQADSTALIGAGTHLIDVYSALAPHGIGIPAGSCPTVGIAGLAMGGGLGVVGRKFGLTCDNITQLEIVTAAGDALTCNANTNADLFWACRGGGGGNFGIVTSLTLSTHPISAVTLFTLAWPWSAAGEVIAAWQHWITTIPDELWTICHVLNTKSGPSPSITVDGAYVGTSAALTPWLNTLRSAAGGSSSSVGTYGYLNAMLTEAGCSGETVAACHLPTQTPQGTYAREPSLAHSDIAVEPLSTAAINVILSGVQARQANPMATTRAGVALDALGGAINRVAPDATAFVHRNGLFSTQYNATWPIGASAAVVASNVAGVNALYAAMRPYASGAAYQNYIDPSLATWQQAYYGANLPRLMSVQAQYDPTGVLEFAQSIPRS